MSGKRNITNSVFNRGKRTPKFPISNRASQLSPKLLNQMISPVLPKTPVSKTPISKRKKKKQFTFSN